MKELPKIYLDTSIINFLFAIDSPEKMEITKDFFNNFIKPGIYHTFISDFVVQEINQTGDAEKKERLLNAIQEYFIENIEIKETEDLQKLADVYLSRKIIPPSKLIDALHIACSVINHFDFLVSWNYKHLANVNRERKVMAVNLELGYLHPIRIITPLELIDYGS